jgi:hypothetical protein
MNLLVINLEQGIRELDPSRARVRLGLVFVLVVEGVEVLAIGVDKVALASWAELVVVEDLGKELRANAPGGRVPDGFANSSCDH